MGEEKTTPALLRQKAGDAYHFDHAELLYAAAEEIEAARRERDRLRALADVLFHRLPHRTRPECGDDTAFLTAAQREALRALSAEVYRDGEVNRAILGVPANG